MQKPPRIINTNRVKTLTLGTGDPFGNFIESFVIPVAHLPESQLLFQAGNSNILVLRRNTQFRLNIPTHIDNSTGQLSPFMKGLRKAGISQLGVLVGIETIQYSISDVGVLFAKAGDTSMIFALNDRHQVMLSRDLERLVYDTLPLPSNIISSLYSLTLTNFELEINSKPRGKKKPLECIDIVKEDAPSEQEVESIV